MSANETIESGKVITLNYTLSNDAGEVLDRADKDDPFVYLHGVGQIVPGLEEALEGKAIGHKAKIKVLPKSGYGDVDPELHMVVKSSQFPPGTDIKEGMQFETETTDGYGVIFTVEKLDGESVHINGNHPLAGVTLHFDVEVLEIREATAEEMTHGHAHGPGDDHHH